MIDPDGDMGRAIGLTVGIYLAVVAGSIPLSFLIFGQGPSGIGSGLATASLPADMSRLLAQRFDGLSEDAWSAGRMAATYGASMDPSDLARRDAVTGWARQQGWNLPGDPRMSSLDGILGGLTDGQRSAVSGRFTAMDWIRNRTAARVSGDAGTVRDAFAGGADGGIAGSTRAAAIAEAEIRVRKEYTDTTEREIALKREIADIASREKDIRTRATVAIDTETRIIEARLPGVPERLSKQILGFVQKLDSHESLFRMSALAVSQSMNRDCPSASRWRRSSRMSLCQAGDSRASGLRARSSHSDSIAASFS